MTPEWQRFLEAIETAKDQLGVAKSGAWYRGVSSAKFRLYPSLLRPVLARNSSVRSKRGLAQTREPQSSAHKLLTRAEAKLKRLKKREEKIFEEFINFDEHPETGVGWSWERLVKLQHFGIPTRLLDWSEVFGCALFFAIGEMGSEIPRSPSIWIMNPFTLAKVARQSNDKRIGTFHLQADYEYFVRFLEGEQLSWPYRFPIPYRPPKLTPRIRAQRGFFTVHGEDCRPINAIFPNVVRQVRLPSQALPDARAFLERAGINSLSMFPDYEGFARRVKRNYE
jgi:hypothetical protein